MTIQQLTTLLSQYPPDTRIVLAGYEGGFNDINIHKIIHLKLDANKEWWYGQHEEVRSSGEEALLLAGENRISEEYLGKQEEKPEKMPTISSNLPGSSKVERSMRSN